MRKKKQESEGDGAQQASQAPTSTSRVKKTTTQAKVQQKASQAKPLPKDDSSLDPKPVSKGRISRAKKIGTITVEVASEKPATGVKKTESKGKASGRKEASGTQKSIPKPRQNQNDVPSEAEMPLLTWRAAQAEPKSSPDSKEGVKLAPRRSRGRKRADQHEREITAADALVRQPKPEKPGHQTKQERSRAILHGEEQETRSSRRRSRFRKPHDTPPVQGEQEQPTQRAGLAPIQQRETVPIPDDAPQVVIRDGIPTLVKNHQVIPPLFFFGAALDEKRAAIVLDEIKLASEHGVHTFVHYLEFEVELTRVDDAVGFAGYLLKKTLEVDPEACVIFRLVFTALKGWEQSFPRAKYIAASGGLAEPSVCDDVFWGQAEECLSKFIKKLRMIDDGNHVIGLHLERGEWFFADGWGYDTSPAAHDKFREWVRLRYREDVVSLRAAWFDGAAQFETVTIPPYKQSAQVGEEFVRMGRKARRWVDYHLFLSDVTVERISKLAHGIKVASEGRYLVGASYGYTFEWSHPASGHLSLGKLLRAPEVDFIAGPPSYKNREPSGSAPFSCPIDSFALNGKLYISEEDFKTPISHTQEPDDFNPTLKTPQALESVHWRGIGSALAHSSGACWMDLWGNGWLSTIGIWERGQRVQEALTSRMAAPVGEPEVAVFIDERSLAYLVDQSAFTQLVQNVREAVLRSGLSVGFYLLSDLAHRERFPESKLYIFMNAWDIRPEVRSAIKNRLQQDGKVLFWLYAAGLFESGREALERVREVTGIALKAQPFFSKLGTALLNRRHPLCEAIPERLLNQGSNLEPSFFAIPDEDTTVLAEYSATGLPSFVVSSFGTDSDPSQRWTSVFLGEPVVTPELIRTLGQKAGAHIWNYQNDVVHVRPPFLTVHCSGAGQRTLTLPDKWSAFNLLTREWAASDSTHLRFQAIDGSTHSFLIGLKAEVEAILAADPATLLRIEEIAPRPENTLDQSSALFDVPIMKLDEWMEEGLSSELSEDLLIIPAQLEASFEQESASSSASTQNGRGRGRRRRGRGRGGGSEETASSRREGADRQSFDEINMNVVFRKRE